MLPLWWCRRDRGRPTPSGLAQAAWLGRVVFVVGFFVGWLLITHDRRVLATGRGIQAVPQPGGAQRGRGPATCPSGLSWSATRSASRLGANWWKALLFALGNWLFDYLALLAALAAGRVIPATEPWCSLAYSASMVLAMIPITPGGLGFVRRSHRTAARCAGGRRRRRAADARPTAWSRFWLPLPAAASRRCCTDALGPPERGVRGLTLKRGRNAARR
jgi:hypothetical protein